MKRLLTATLLAFASVAGAEEYPAPVQILIDQGVEVQAEFDAPGGLTGYVGRVQGRPIALYLTADGEHVIVGNMLDGEGSNLTGAQIEEHLPEPEFAEAWSRLEEATWVAEGGSDPERIVYVFDDPNCPYCKQLWEASQAYLDEDVQVRHVMVAVLKPSSMGKAARIVAADDPQEAFLEHQHNGSEPLEDIPSGARERIEANNRLMRELGSQATPTVLYKDREGKVRQAVGLPSDEKLTNEIFQKPPR